MLSPPGQRGLEDKIFGLGLIPSVLVIMQCWPDSHEGCPRGLVFSHQNHLIVNELHSFYNLCNISGFGLIESDLGLSLTILFPPQPHSIWLRPRPHSFLASLTSPTLAVTSLNISESKKQILWQSSAIIIWTSMLSTCSARSQLQTV